MRTRLLSLLVLVLASLAIAACGATSTGSGAKPMGQMNVSQLKSKLDAGDNLFLIDVRTPQEYAEAHLPCAVNMPLESLSENLGRVPAGTLLVHCKSGMRSNMATQLLKRNGFRNVHNLGSFDRARSIVEPT